MQENFKDDQLLSAAAAILTGLNESIDKSKFPLNKKDPGEYDYEGSMVKNALRTIIRNAKGLHDMLADDENLPEHVQAAIVKAEEAIVGARDYIESEKELE